MVGVSKKKVAELEATVEVLQKDTERFRKALEFYADTSNWSAGLIFSDADDATSTERRQSPAERDKGAVAMRALKGP